MASTLMSCSKIVPEPIVCPRQSRGGGGGGGGGRREKGGKEREGGKKEEKEEKGEGQRGKRREI